MTTYGYKRRQLSVTLDRKDYITVINRQWDGTWQDKRAIMHELQNEYNATVIDAVELAGVY